MLRCYFKKAPLISILTILSLIGFLLMFVVNIYFTREFRYVNVAIYIIPFFCLSFVAYLRVNDKLKKALSILITIILIFVLSFIMIANTMFIILKEATKETKNISAYSKVLNIYGYPKSKMVSHFPKIIPQDAKRVRFYETHQFLQGGSSIFLLFETTDDELDLYRNKYIEAAQIVLPMGKKQTTSHMDDYYPPNVFKEAIGYDNLSIDFEIIIIDSKPYKVKDWNHGYSYGLAISKTKNEILFYSEQW